MSLFPKIVLTAALAAAIGFAPTAEARSLGALAKLIPKLSDRVVIDGVEEPMSRASARLLGEQILDNRPSLDTEWIIEQLGSDSRFSREDIDKLLRQLQGEAQFPNAEDHFLFHDILSELAVTSKNRTYRFGPLCDVKCQMSSLRRIDENDSRWELQKRATQADVDEIQTVLTRLCQDKTGIQMCLGTKPNDYQVTMSCADMAISFSMSGDTTLKVGNFLVSAPGD